MVPFADRSAPELDVDVELRISLPHLLNDHPLGLLTIGSIDRSSDALMVIEVQEDFLLAVQTGLDLLQVEDDRYSVSVEAFVVGECC